jgi:hypothetical protein
LFFRVCNFCDVNVGPQAIVGLSPDPFMLLSGPVDLSQIEYRFFTKLVNHESLVAEISSICFVVDGDCPLADV